MMSLNYRTLSRTLDNANNHEVSDNGHTFDNANNHDVSDNGHTFDNANNYDALDNGGAFDNADTFSTAMRPCHNTTSGQNGG
jgi:hypothetical protein